MKIAEGMGKFCDDRKIEDIGSLVGSLVTTGNVSVVDSWL
jgi:hypothetical protein